MKLEFNVLIKDKYQENDKDLFFGPLTDETDFIVFDDNKLLAHLLTELGLFQSVSQAKKNGWDKPLPQGYSEFTIGKLKTRVCILNPFE